MIVLSVQQVEVEAKRKLIPIEKKLDQGSQQQARGYVPLCASADTEESRVPVEESCIGVAQGGEEVRTSHYLATTNDRQGDKQRSSTNNTRSSRRSKTLVIASHWWPYIARSQGPYYIASLKLSSQLSSQ